MSQLTQWNGISKRSLLKPGQKLTVWVKDEEPEEQGKLVKTVVNNDSSSNAYIVQRGDSLWTIARKFDIRVSDLLEWNKLKKDKHLQPGQSLIVQAELTGV